jgi:hypothetical protein
MEKAVSLKLDVCGCTESSFWSTALILVFSRDLIQSSQLVSPKTIQIKSLAKRTAMQDEQRSPGVAYAARYSKVSKELSNCVATKGQYLCGPGGYCLAT